MDNQRGPEPMDVGPDPPGASGLSPADSSAGSGGFFGGVASTSSSAVDETNRQKDLRRQILSIQSSSASPHEKARAMQQLLAPQPAAPASSASSSSYTLTEKDLEITYHSKADGILGCKHYQRKCKIKAECCGKLFTCRFCHDQACDHQIDRHAIQTVFCMVCESLQPFAESCKFCGVRFARYVCEVCKFFDDDPDKNIYHCPFCKMCRIGQGLGIDYFHCQKCNACMSLSLRDHKCIENTLDANCPICHEPMFTSVIPVIFMQCGHCMHDQCFTAYTQTNYTCPICAKSLTDMTSYFERLDVFMSQQTMPEEYRDTKSHIFCNDCEIKSVVPFHFLYHKCPACKGYNTKVTGTTRPEDE